MTTNRNFNDLYAFTQVVKLGNFSRAAQSLGVQPSALSHRMNDLENRLNTKKPHHPFHVAYGGRAAAV